MMNKGQGWASGPKKCSLEHVAILFLACILIVWFCLSISCDDWGGIEEMSKKIV